MPRGKDAPTQTGGQIDPYVQRSLQQDKQLASNRLIASMQEAGATGRAQLASTTQIQTQETRGAQQRTAQAAQLEADDRRAAEAERGRRDDMKFTDAMQKSNQVFQAKQAELTREHKVALVSGDRDYLGKLEDKRNTLRRFEIEKQTVAQERTTNALLSIVKGGLQREAGRERAVTVLNQEADQFDKDKDIYERTKTRVVEGAGSDKRLDYHIADILTEQLEARKKKGLLGIATRGPLGVISAGVDIYKSYKEVRELEGVANPVGVTQGQLDKYVKVSVEDLAPENIHKLEEGIQNGTVPAEDVRSILGVLEGMEDVLSQKRKDNPLDKGESTYDFWNNSYQFNLSMRDAVESLANSQKKIKDNEAETVGSRVQYALGVIRNNSLGVRAARLRELSGGNFETVFEEITKPLQVPSLWTIEPEMGDYEREIREEENAMLMRLYPELGGIE